MARKAFSSYRSFEDAALEAKMAGYVPVGQIRNQRTGQFVVFAEEYNAGGYFGVK